MVDFFFRKRHSEARKDQAWKSNGLVQIERDREKENFSARSEVVFVLSDWRADKVQQKFQRESFFWGISILILLEIESYWMYASFRPAQNDEILPDNWFWFSQQEREIK